MTARKTTAAKTATPKTTAEVKADDLELLADQPEDSVDLVQKDEGTAVVDPSEAEKTVEVGNVIAASGSTGNSKGNHIHIEAPREIEVLVGGFYVGGRALPAGAKVSVSAKLASETKEEQIASYGKQMFRAI